MADDGLVGHWAFDSQDARKTEDASGNGYTAHLHGDAEIISDAERGKVLQLRGQGSGDRVTMPSLAKEHVIPKGGGATIALWVRRNSDGKAGGAYTSLFSLAGSASEFLSLALRPGKGGLGPSGIFFILEGDKPGNNTDGDQCVIRLPGNVPDEKWMHIAVSFDREANAAFAYINGIPLGPFDIATVGDGPLHWVSASIADFGGRIDDLRYYSTQLSHKQVQALYTDSNHAAAQSKPAK